ncbi:MAG: hypothetical protein JO186_11710 [Actinobacteria bacterium]|nr:hypothetical protein [Actinomycetota bacterium]
MERNLVLFQATRPGSDATFAVTGTVGAFQNAHEVPACESAIPVVLQQNSGGGAWTQVGKPALTNGKGDFSITSPTDVGDFRVDVPSGSVAPFDCGGDTKAIDRIPPRPVKRTITATAQRLAGNLSVIHVTGSIDNGGVASCNPTLALVDNRKAGSKDDWSFVGWVTVVDDQGDFAGDLNARGGTGLEWRVAAYDSVQGRYLCMGATAPLAVQPQPDQRTLTFTTKRTVGAFPAELDGTLASDTTECSTQATVSVDGFGGGTQSATTGSSSGTFAARGAIPLDYPNAPFRVSIPTETVGGVVCRGTSFETRAFDVSSVTNLEGQVQVAGKLLAISGRCRGPVTVELQSLQPNAVWTHVASATTGADGSFTFTANDPGNAYGADGWRVSVDGAAYDDGRCAGAARTFTLPAPTPKPPPPAPPAADLQAWVDQATDGTDAVITFHVRSTPVSAMPDCVAGQTVYVAWDRGDGGFPDYTGAKLDKDGNGTLRMPLTRLQQQFIYSMKAVTKGTQACNALPEDGVIVPGYQQPPAIESVAIKDVSVTTGGWAGDAGGNQVEVKGRLEGWGTCIGYTPVELYRTQVNGETDIFVPFPPYQRVTSHTVHSPWGGTTDADGNFDFTFTDPGDAYMTRGWMIRALPPLERNSLTKACGTDSYWFTLPRPPTRPTSSLKLAVTTDARPGAPTDHGSGRFGNSVTITATITASPAASACTSGLTVHAEAVGFQEPKKTRTVVQAGTPPSTTYFAQFQVAPIQPFDDAPAGADGVATLDRVIQGNFDTTWVITAAPTSKSYPSYCGKPAPVTITIPGTGGFISGKDDVSWAY